jgi:hypothetical protein
MVSAGGPPPPALLGLGEGGVGTAAPEAFDVVRQQAATWVSGWPRSGPGVTGTAGARPQRRVRRCAAYSPVRANASAPRSRAARARTTRSTLCGLPAGKGERVGSAVLTPTATEPRRGTPAKRPTGRRPTHPDRAGGRRERSSERLGRLPCPARVIARATPTQHLPGRRRLRPPTDALRRRPGPAERRTRRGPPSDGKLRVGRSLGTRRKRIRTSRERPHASSSGPGSGVFTATPTAAPAG